jgi:hypothetical protein
MRLWRTQGSAQPGELSWKSNDPAVCLALDLIAAGQGVASSPNGRFLVASFTGIQPAILTARRLQWALLGFAESDRFAGTAAAVLLHSTPDLPALQADSSALLPLENATPGQILLTPNTAELLQDLPGLPLQAVSGDGLCELLWRASQETASRSADEDTVSKFIKLHGLEVEAPAPLQAPPVPPPTPLPTETDRSPYAWPEAVDTSAPVPDAGESVRPRANPRLLIGAACAAAIVLVVVLILAVSHRGAATPAAIAVQPAASTVTPSSSLVASVTQPANVPPPTGTASPQAPVTTTAPAQTTRKHQEPAQANAKPADIAKSQPDEPKIAAGNCDLDSNLLPKMLDQAEKSREQGNYPAALRQYRAVLACDRNNARARSGLDLTEFAMQHR